MKLRVLGFLGFLIAVAPVSGYAGGNDWMSRLNGHKTLAEFSIPGTHDSGAMYEPIPGTAKCQNLSVKDQLNAGVRFLDIRCRHVNNSFDIHHGMVYQNQNFDAVLDAVISFLHANPTECVVMSVKEEYTSSGNTRSFEDTFDSYTAKNPHVWYLSQTIPTLNDVHGKIVLFRRFGARKLPKGIDASDWPDNTSFHTSRTLSVQDNYNVTSTGTKWTEVQKALNDAKSGSPDTLYVNFASGVKSGLFGIPNVPDVSNIINPNLTTYFAANKHGRYGVTLVDFADAKMCSIIYNTNFP